MLAVSGSMMSLPLVSGRIDLDGGSCRLMAGRRDREASGLAACGSPRMSGEPHLTRHHPTANMSHDGLIVSDFR